MPTTQPEAFPASRPTLSSGLATNPILSAPAVTAPPLANLPSTRTAGVGGPSQPSATGSNAASGAATPQASTSAAPLHGGPAPALGQPGPLALKNAEGRPYNKRKLQELVASIDPNQQLEAQVEDVSQIHSAQPYLLFGALLTLVEMPPSFFWKSQMIS